MARRGFSIKRSHEFEHTRILAYTILKVNADPSKPLADMRQLWPLDTDEPEEKTEQEINEEVAHYKQLMANAAEMYKNFPS